MSQNNLFDPEYEWILRICMNAFNVYITMTHFMFYDNAVDLHAQNSETYFYTAFMTAFDLFAYCIFQ